MGNRRSRSAHVSHIAGVLLCLLLLSGQAGGISKLTAPALDEQDLPLYLHKSMPADNTHLYLFSSMSLISRRRDNATFELSAAPAQGVTPLLSLKIHPAPDVLLQPELLDVTIWGQLGNLFQKQVGLLAIEREILALFKELEELNARYLALLGDQAGRRSEAQRPITLDRRNYLQQRPEAGARRGGKSEQASQTAATSAVNADPRHLIQQHEQGIQTEYLTPQLAARVEAGRAPALETTASAAASMRASEAKQDPEVTGAVPEGRLFHLFKLLKLIIRYVLENKIEAIIYLWVLVLLSASVKAMRKRS